MVLSTPYSRSSKSRLVSSRPHARAVAVLLAEDRDREGGLGAEVDGLGEGETRLDTVPVRAGKRGGRDPIDNSNRAAAVPAIADAVAVHILSQEEVGLVFLGHFASQQVRRQSFAAAAAEVDGRREPVEHVGPVIGS